MKIVNLKEYNEGDGFRNKLRQRVDQFEPELPDSLWDRIHHEMDERETNRKKRFLWWFSSVAVVLLASGILTFLMVNSSMNPALVQQTQTTQAAPQAPAAVQSETGTPQQPSHTNEGAVAGSETPLGSENTTPAQPATNGGGNNNHTNPNNNATNNNGNDAVVDLPEDKGTPIEEELIIIPDAGTKKEVTPDKNDGKDNENPIVTESKKEEGNVTEGEKEQPKEEVLPTSKNKNNNDSGAKDKGTFKRFFVGAVYGYNMTYRTVSQVEKIPGYTTAEQKNDYEFNGYTASYGLEFGYAPIKDINVFIKSGVGIYKTEEIVKYSVFARKKIRGGGQGILGEEKDSVDMGNAITKQNTYTYIQIPLEIQYNININKGFGVFVSGAVAYNMLNSYNYNYYEPYYGRMVVSVDNNNSNYFTNYLQVGGGVGAQYTLGKNWRASAGMTYRKAITNAATKETGVDVRPHSLGANAGVVFTF